MYQSPSLLAAQSVLATLQAAQIALSQLAVGSVSFKTLIRLHQPQGVAVERSVGQRHREEPEPAPEPALEPAHSLEPEPALEPAPEPALEPAHSLEPEPALEPAPEPALEPAHSLEPEPALDPGPDLEPAPTLDPGLAPALEPALDPGPDLEPAPTLDPALGLGSALEPAFEPTSTLRLEPTLEPASEPEELILDEIPRIELSPGLDLASPVLLTASNNFPGAESFPDLEAAPPRSPPPLTLQDDLELASLKPSTVSEVRGVGSAFLGEELEPEERPVVRIEPVRVELPEPPPTPSSTSRSSGSSPLRIVIPQTLSSRTRASRQEEVIITGEGTNGEEEDDAEMRVSLEAPSLERYRVPELTDDSELTGISPGATQVSQSPPLVDDRNVERLLTESRQAYEKGELQKAIQWLTDALEMRPDRVDAYIMRGTSFLDLGDYSSAMSDFQRAEDLEPNKPGPHFAMGNLYFNRKEYKRAIEFYDHALELDGSHAMARCRRGISNFYRKNYRQAVQDLQAAYRLDPEIPNIRKYVQMAMKKMDKPE